MVPMADNLNHNSIEIRNEMVVLSLHIKGDDTDNKWYYHDFKYLADYTTLYDKNGYNEEQI